MPHKHQKVLEEDGIVGVYTDEDGDTVVQHDGTVSDSKAEALSPDKKYEVVPGGIVPHKRRIDRFRPVQTGISHGATDVTAGTTGVLVLKDGTGPFIDTNYHVAVGPERNEREPILQPGSHDDGDMPDDKYGELYWSLDMDVEPNRLSKIFQYLLNLRRRGNSKPKYYVQKTKEMMHDVALVEPTDAEVVKDIYGADNYPDEIKTAPVGEICMKAGRTTGVTEMRLTSKDWTGQIRYPWGTVKFVDQHIYKGVDGPGSKGGDSGSTVMWDNWSKVDGRLFAGNEKAQITIANPYEHFAEEHNIRLY